MRHLTKIILISVIGCMFILLIGCAHTIMLQPHIDVGDAVGLLKGKKAVIFIPSDVLAKEYTSHSFFGGNIIIPLGSPVRDLTLETFLPFYDQVTSISAKNYEGTGHLIEVDIVNFEVDQGLDVRATISCIISDIEGQIFSGSWVGEGEGEAAAGFFSGSMAREQVRKSSNKALLQAFTMLREAYIEFIQKNPNRFK